MEHLFIKFQNYVPIMKLYSFKYLINLSQITILIISCFQVLNSQILELIPYSAGFIKPVDISNSGVKGDSRLFITEKDGLIKIIQSDGSKLQTPFLDIDSRVNSAANERGLLGLCFDPNYSSNGYFYVHYTNNNGHSTISRFSVSQTDPNVANLNSEKILLVVNQPFNNHNAGDLDFGPDGYLYIGMGDGGSGGDPGNRSQNPKTLLGKMLRIDVRTETAPYLIPSDNPYVNNTDTLPEIWAIGLRNPWRFSFDTFSNEIWIADVGQDKWEEVNVAPVSAAGLNYGWKCYEGFDVFNLNLCNANNQFHFPISSYPNSFDIGCSVTGGYVYRGTQNANLYGKYIFTDFCTGIMWGLYRNEMGQWQKDVLGDFDNMEFATFGVDIDGELYVAGLANGTVFKIKSQPSNSMDEVKNNMQLKFNITPNPAQNFIDIHFENDIFLNAEWSIYSIGDAIFNTNIVGKTERSLSLSIEQLPPGIYFVKSNKNAFVQKFIKTF